MWFNVHVEVENGANRTYLRYSTNLSTETLEKLGMENGTMTRRERRAERLNEYANSKANIRSMFNDEGEIRLVGKSASRWHWNNRLHGHPVNGKFPNRSERVRTIS